MSTQRPPHGLFTFTYHESATATIKPRKAVQCEGAVFSDGMVALKTPDKEWCGYDSLDDMFQAFSKHGKGKIRFHAGGDSNP